MDEYSDLRIDFVRNWTEGRLGLKLDEEQASAVAALGGDVLVTARAGSGKTRTLVTRAVFLQQHCGVKPNELLLLAFNKKAALEMQDRLHTVLKDDVPHVMTFHALAYALVHPDDELLYDEPTAPLQSRVIQQIIDAHLRSDEFRPVIRSLMLSHFRDDWERIEKGGFNLPSGEGVKYRRALPRETLAGEYVKSYGEKLIANTLFEHDIDYRYERRLRWNGVNYKPDFTVLLGRDKGVAIEYFGLRGDVDYDEMSVKKREFWRRKQGWTLIELTPRDIAGGGGEDLAGLLQALAQLGLKSHRLSDEEIWQRIERRAIDKFSGAVTSFVRRCRARALGLSDLEHLVAGHCPLTEAEGQFLEVACSVYGGYLKRLQDDSLTDFDGLMWDAVGLLAAGGTAFARQKGKERGDVRRFRYILIDEFQDFTDVFNELAQSLRRLAPSAEFFCVGDDWQAINGFAGSELRFFRDFGTYFRSIREVEISTSYRSPSGVVRIGNAVMEGLGTPARAIRRDPGVLEGGWLVDFEPSAAEADRHGGDEGTPAILRLVKKLLNDGFDVVLLCRTNHVPWYVEYETRLSPLSGIERFEEHVRSFLPEEDRPRVTVSTAHKYKGLEKDAVVVLDADTGSYPLIHPNWVFLRIFGDDLGKLEAEERRLFYVALTRAQAALVILSEQEGTESPYLAGARRRVDIQEVDWAELSPVPSLSGAKLDVRVRFAFDEELNARLRQLKYRWDAAGKCWHRLMTADDFDFEAFCRQDWVRPGVRIEVRSENGMLVHERRCQ